MYKKDNMGIATLSVEVAKFYLYYKSSAIYVLLIVTIIILK